jgi:hypothetical protein
MAGMNFRNAYEFDPETYGGEGGGLPGMLRRMIQEQGQQQGAGIGPTPNGTLEYNPASYDSPQGGLLGRLLALQKEQSQYRPVPGANEQAPVMPPNLNFGQALPATVPSRPQGMIGTSDLSNDQSSPARPPFDGSAFLNLLGTSQMQQSQYKPTPVLERDAQRRILAQSIRDTSRRLGIDPQDLATAISYETKGTFNPWEPGPITEWGQHHGLIQFGVPQARQYGVTKDSTIPEQMSAVRRYLVDRGVKPGMGLLDIYAAINAGRVGRYNVSDEKNGGTPGTVAEKVSRMDMEGHRRNGERLLARYAPATFPTTPQKPIPILSRRVVGQPRSTDADVPAYEWGVPSPIFDPLR